MLLSDIESQLRIPVTIRLIRDDFRYMENEINDAA